MPAQPPLDGVPVGPPADLLTAVAGVVERWLADLVVATAARTHATSGELTVAAQAMAAEQAPVVLARLSALLARDVDDQRSNPLSILRDATGPATDLLRSVGVPTPGRDAFDAAHFPGDPYGLGPATWRDVDESLHEPGIAWGAWKAATVLARRRDEGRR